jgi:P27 family predicted phage terminase small subunit
LIIERYCQLQERRQELLALIEADGWVTTGSQNQMVSHPAAKLLDSIEGRLGPIEDRIALNPEARLRLGITSVEHNTKLERFLDKGGSY